MRKESPLKVQETCYGKRVEVGGAFHESDFTAFSKSQKMIPDQMHFWINVVNKWNEHGKETAGPFFVHYNRIEITTTLSLKSMLIETLQFSETVALAVVQFLGRKEMKIWP